jgi:IS5 family transposase
MHSEEEQTTQWPKEKEQKDKQRSTKHTHKTKDRVTRTPLKTGDELRCSGRVSSACSTSGTRRVNLVTNLVISHKLSMVKRCTCMRLALRRHEYTLLLIA